MVTKKITVNELRSLVKQIMTESKSITKNSKSLKESKTSTTKKVTSNGLTSLVKQIIKEESDPYNGKLEKILADINQLKSPVTNKPPKTFVRDGFIYVSAEDGNYFADYYGEYKEEMYIDPRLEKIANKYNMSWDWEDAGSIILGY